MISPVKIWRNQKKTATLLGKVGKIVSWTFIRVPPSGFENQAPYPVALVKLSDGKRIIAQVVDYQGDIRLGQSVVTIIRKIKEPGAGDVIQYGIKVKPV